VNKRIDTLLVLQARIDARAQLWMLGNYATPSDMMLPLYNYAKQMDLFEKLGGVDGIDNMMLVALDYHKSKKTG